MEIDYFDEVTQEQALAIEKLLAPEFESGEWVEVEGEGLG